MSRTFRAPTWEDRRDTREASKRASTLVRNGSVAPAAFCLGKVAYPSRNEATHAAKNIRARSSKAMHAYPCPRCSLYHLSTTEL